VGTEVQLTVTTAAAATSFESGWWAAWCGWLSALPKLQTAKL